LTATTATYALPYPEATDAPNGPAQIQALAQAVDALVASITARYAKGIVARVPVGTSADIGTTETITASGSFTAEAGRDYEITLTTPVLDNQGTGAQTAIVTARWAAGASVSNAGNLIAKGDNNTPGSTGSSTAGSAAETVTIHGSFYPNIAGQVTVGVGLAALSATTNIRFLQAGTVGPDLIPELIVKDIGAHVA
jgi:hypothetical protein